MNGGILATSKDGWNWRLTWVLVLIVPPLWYAMWTTFVHLGEPTVSIIRCQTEWGRTNEYSPLLTVIAAWLTAMVPVSFVEGLYWAVRHVIGHLTRERLKEPVGREWKFSASEEDISVFGLFPFSIGIIGYSLLLIQPNLFSFLGVGCVALFVFLPLCLIIGWVAVLNLLLPKIVVIGPVAALFVVKDSQNQAIEYVAIVNGREWSLLKESWQKLQLRQEVFLRTSPIARDVLEIVIRDVAPLAHGPSCGPISERASGMASD